MALRKLIKFGKSSYVISLPTEWIKRNKLEKGDEILLDERDGNLNILPTSKEKKKETKKITISIDKKPIKEIEREIVVAYINGYDILYIEGNEIEDRYEEITSFLQNIVSMEIMEQAKQRIVAKVLLNVRDISLNALIKRMSNISVTMVIDTRTCIHNKKSCRYIYKRDKDVNRLSFLCYRLIRSAVNNPDVARLFRKTNIELLDDYWLIVNIEKIADCSKRIARSLEKIEIDESRSKKFEEIYGLVEKRYVEGLKTYYKADKTSAHQISNEHDDVIKKCETFLKDNDNNETIKTIEQLKAMESFIHNITRMVVGSEITTQ